MPNGRAVWIGESNSTPVIDGLYTLSNKAGSGPYTYTLIAFANSSFPVNVTSAGTAGKIMSMGHSHAASYIDDHTHAFSHAGHPHTYTPNNPWTDATTSGGSGIGIHYVVIFNSGKNTSGMNSHFSQNHVSHP